MNIKKALKDIPVLHLMVKKAKIHHEFSCDARMFANNYLDMAESRGNYAYEIMLLVHSLEKGMCMTDSRPFGQEKAQHLLKLLQNWNAPVEQNFEYRLGCSTLKAWIDYIDCHSWQQQISSQDVRSFLGSVDVELFPTGRVEFHAPMVTNNSTFDQVIFSRRSVRDYSNEPLRNEDVSYALDCFLAAPTACNRQMCKVYRIVSDEKKKLLDQAVMGISGFNKDTVNYFIITFDMSAFGFSGERNQGYLNAGLTAMNFINGLHARGIGSCCLQWSNPSSEDVSVRKSLHLKESERIAVVIGAGYYLESSVIPQSCRKSKEHIFEQI